MSSREEPQPTMLILSRAIYAKRSDNSFYPGTVETKLPDGSYLVNFTDGPSERVEEHEITWLGFWGLPPWSWPRNPIVQPAGSANSELLNAQLRNDNSKDDLSSYVSFRTLFQQRNERVKRLNGSNGADMNPGTITNGCDDSAKLRLQSKEEAKFEQHSAHVSPTRISQNQMRTSVLRMCCNGSSKQERGKTDNAVSSTENQIQTPAFTPSPHSITSNNEDPKQFNFDEDEAQIIKNDVSKRKRKLSSPEHEKCSVGEKYTSRSETIEKRLRNSPPVQKHNSLSPTLPPFIPHHFHNYGQPFGISIHNSSSPPSPASFRLQTRTRRRSESKKCRKVYGIENRDIWCTQCKWKKACTRFPAAEKSDLPEFMYMSDYEGRQRKDLGFERISLN